MKIITNNQPRLILDGHDLTPDEKAEFDYDFTDHDFIRYKGEVYDLHEFSSNHIYPGTNKEIFEGWHGYQSDTFFSGILVRYIEHDDDHVIMGRYYT